MHKSKIKNNPNINKLFLVIKYMSIIYLIPSSKNCVILGFEISQTITKI